PKRAPHLPTERCADHEKYEVRDRRARAPFGRHDQKLKKNGEVAEVHGYIPSTDESDGCPDQREHRKAVEEEPSKEVRRPGDVLCRIDGYGQQCSTCEGDSRACTKPLEAHPRRRFELLEHARVDCRASWTYRR